MVFGLVMWAFKFQQLQMQVLLFGPVTLTIGMPGMIF